MPLTVVVGGQFGSEGKGKVAHEFARRMNATVAVRVGGSNSGHTVIDQNGRPRIFRHLPTAALLPETICVIGAGAYIDVDVLLNEVAETGLPRGRLLIDPNAVVITEEHKEAEKNWHIRERIGSTESGTGAALVNRIRRDSCVDFAKDEDRLAQFVRPVRPFLRDRLNRDERILVEGTQGFGLSLLHSDDYPNVTSRDTTAAAFVSEAGLSPLDVDEIVLVLRAFPIRVAGNSGGLPNEIDWEAITKESGNPEPIIERTSVTGRIRRVARFDPDVVRSAIQSNSPTTIVLNHVDHIDARCGPLGRLTREAWEFISWVEDQIDEPIAYVGLGPSSLIHLQRVQEAISVTG